MTDVVILHINKLVSQIGNGQLCVEPSADSETGYRMWCGKDAVGGITKWLAKGKAGVLSTLKLTGSGTVGDSGILVHDANGNVDGGPMTVADLNSYLIDGPIQQVGLDEVYQYLGSTGQRTGGTISDAGSQAFDVAAGDGFFRVTDSHVDGLEKLSWSESPANAIPDGEARYVFAQYNGGAPVITIKSSYSSTTTNEFFLGSVVREGTLLHIFNNPDVVTNPISRLNERFRHGGVQWAEGLAIGETGTRNLTIAEGEVYFKLNELPFSQFDSSSGGTFDVYVGTTKDATGETQWPNGYYNNGGVKTALTTGRYTSLWVYLEGDGNVVLLYGSSNATTVAGAEAEQPPTTIPLRLQTHGFLLGRLVIQQGGSSAEDIESAVGGQYIGTPVGDHNLLSNLNVGTAYLHLDSTQKTGLVDGNSTTLHKHPANYIVGVDDKCIPYGQGAANGLAWDSTFVWDSANSRVGIGTATPQSNVDVVSADSNAEARWTSWATSSGVYLRFYRGRNNAVNDYTALQSGDQIAAFIFGGADGTALNTGAYLQVDTAVAWGAADRGTVMRIRTTAPGSTTLRDTATFSGENSSVYNTLSVGSAHGHTLSGGGASSSLVVGTTIFVGGSGSISNSIISGNSPNIAATVTHSCFYGSGHDVDGSIGNSLLGGSAHNIDNAIGNCALLGSTHAIVGTVNESLLVGDTVTVAASGVVTDSIVCGDTPNVNASVTRSLVAGYTFDIDGNVINSIVGGSSHNVDTAVTGCGVFGSSHVVNTNSLIDSLVWGASNTLSSVQYALVGGSGNTVSSNYGLTTGTGNTNNSPYCEVVGKYAVSEWERGRYISTDKLLAGSSAGEYQMFSEMFLMKRVTSTTVRYLDFELFEGTGYPGAPFAIENGYSYEFEITCNAAWDDDASGFAWYGRRVTKFLCSISRSRSGTDTFDYEDTTVGDLNTPDGTSPGTFSIASNIGQGKMYVTFTANANCSSTTPINVSARIRGSRIRNNFIHVE